MTRGSDRMRVVSVVGARPNFVKLAPLARALDARGTVDHVIVHTGQHYDPAMSDAFFRELRIPAPDHHLGVGSGSHANQTAAVMQRLEPLFEPRPDLVLVYGDVNSTLAAALVAAKLGIRLGHVEAGLRSGDWTMPEEINRVVTDRLSQLLLIPSRDAEVNLRAEGIPAERIHFVGNVMIDSLCWALPRALERDVAVRHGVRAGEYVVVTLHRPSNVDDPVILRTLFEALRDVSRERPLVFPVHPRARERLDAAGVDVGSGSGAGDLRLIAPLGYLDMLGLVASAALVITDSGGLQEETSYLGVPCLTVRPNTERPITCTHGTNALVPASRDALLAAARRALARRPVARPLLERWDGHAAERIVRVVCDGAALDVEAAATDRAPGERRAGMFAAKEVVS